MAGHAHVCDQDGRLAGNLAGDDPAQCRLADSGRPGHEQAAPRPELGRPQQRCRPEHAVDVLVDRVPHFLFEHQIVTADIGELDRFEADGGAHLAAIRMHFAHESAVGIALLPALVAQE